MAKVSQEERKLKFENAIRAAMLGEGYFYYDREELHIINSDFRSLQLARIARICVRYKMYYAIRIMWARNQKDELTMWFFPYDKIYKDDTETSVKENKN